jgi:hypothetical protein
VRVVLNDRTVHLALFQPTLQANSLTNRTTDSLSPPRPSRWRLRQPTTGADDMARRRWLSAAAAGLATVIVSTLATPALATTYSPTPAFSWVPNGTVYAMAESGNTVYLGGTFTSLTDPSNGTTVARSRLAALDATTGVPLAWNPNADNTVRALTVNPSTGVVYAGGSFLNVGGTTVSRLAALDPVSGAQLTGFSASAPSTVRDLLVTGSGLYIAGDFATLNSRSRFGLAEVDAGTGSLLPFNAHASGGKVHAVALDPASHTLILGGNFTTLGGVSHFALASVSADTGAVTSWTPAPACSSCQVLDVAVDNGNAFIAAAGSGGHAAAYSLASDVVKWSKAGDGDCEAIAVSGGVVYVGGHFGPNFGGATRHQLAALDELSGALLSYSLTLTGSDHPGIWAILVDSAYLRVGGGLQFANAPEKRYAALPSI